MNKIKRIENIFVALLMSLSGYIIMNYPEEGLVFVLLILGVSLVVKGVQNILYYFSMARYAVGGKIVLYMGIIILDIGILSLNMTQIPEIYIMLYLIACYLFAGVIDVVRSFETKRLEAQSWKLKFFTGVLSIAIAIACIMSIRSVELLTTFYGYGLIYLGCMKMVQSFRKTAIVYIQ